MEGKFDELQLAFIDDVLYQHGDFLQELFMAEIERKGLVKSEDLLNSIDYKVTKEGINPKLSMSFLSYGRAIEIRLNSKNTTKFKAPSTNSIVWGMRNAPRRKKMKDARWYARNAYGSLNRLIGILMYEYSDEVIAFLKQRFEYINQQS